MAVRKHRFVRPRSGSRHASRFPLCHFTGCHACCFPPSACHFAPGFKLVYEHLAEIDVYCLAAIRCASKLPVCLFVAAQGMVMSSHFTFSQGARRWAATIRILWFRWQSSVARLYSRRVTQPVRLWKALGQPSDCMPRLPWWQPIVYKYLVITVWLPVPSRRSQRR